MTSTRNLLATALALAASVAIFMAGQRIGGGGVATVRRPWSGTDWRQATVRIRSVGCGVLGSGSGFAISSSLIVTNRHVVEGVNRIQVNTWDGRSLEASATGWSRSSDLALIRVTGTLDPAAIRTTPSHSNLRVFAVGYPEGNAIDFRDGRVIDSIDGQGFGELGPVIRSDVPVQPGNSGGPLIDEEGQLVGVVFAREVATGNTLSIPAEALSLLPSEDNLSAPHC